MSDLEDGVRFGDDTWTVPPESDAFEGFPHNPQFPTVDFSHPAPFAKPSYDRVTAAVKEALAKSLEQAEVFAAVAIELGCAYAVVEEMEFTPTGGRITHSYLLLTSIPGPLRLTFPSFDAYENWVANGRPL